MVEMKNENKQNRRQRFRNDNVTIVWKIWKIFSWTSGHFGAFFFQFFFFWAPLYENLEIFWVTKWPKTLTLVGSLSQRETRRRDAKQGEQPKRKRLNSCVWIVHIFYEHSIDRLHAPL